ncbi:MAG: pyridoxine 5'-phosphate synthase [Candidatus Omnitrophica bacterium]|nr:pyridoxine 5'-phosphate synthase [Candidatus Omnitrophota bacterium]
MKLGVNIDHVATLRQARGTDYPDPVLAALVCEYAGADSIVAHLREDRRHIQDKDVFALKSVLEVPLNMEMSINNEIVDIACKVLPYRATLVPEKRRELTTEGGLDLVLGFDRIFRAVSRLQDKGIRVSLFIDPLASQINKAKKMGVEMIELNTGRFSEAKTKVSINKEFEKIKKAVNFSIERNLKVACGHGLDYESVKKIASIRSVEELNIGHSIVSRSVYIGLGRAVEEMNSLLAAKKTKKNK